MSDLYSSLKLKMQDSLPWKKGALPVVRLKTGDAAGFNDEMEELERFITQRISRIKEGVRAGEAIVSEESRQAEYLVEDLKAEIEILKTKLKDAEEIIEENKFLQQRTEESLSATIRNLQENLKSKDEALATCDNEINNYKSMIEENIRKIADLEIAYTKAQEDLANDARRAENLAVENQEKIAALEAQVLEKEEIGRQKTSVVKQLQEQLTAKVQEFEGTLKSKQQALAQRDSDIAALHSKLNRLTKGITEISLFFKEAEALAEIDSAAVFQNNGAHSVQELPVSVRPKRDGKVIPVLSDTLAEIVSPETLQNIITDLGQATEIVASLASLIVHQQAKALGESVESFPRSRLPELVNILAKQISDETLKAAFLQRFTPNGRITSS